MAAVFLLFVALCASIASGSYIRHPRDISGSGSGSGAGAFSGASSGASSFSSSSGTKVAPGPGGSGNFNAFAGSSNFGGVPPFGGGPPSFGSDSQGFLRGGGGDGGGGSQFNSQSPFRFPGFNPFISQQGQQFPYQPFPTFAAPFDFMSFLNQYFQSLQNFQKQAEAQAQQAAASGHGIYHKTPGGSVWAYSYPGSPLFPPSSGRFPIDTNEVGGAATATYSPQGGYGAANVFPAPEGGLESRFGSEDGTPQNSVGPVGSVSGNFQPPGGSSFGVFTSSASGSSDINGKKTSFKQATIGINDNGKVTTYSAHDP